MKKQISRSYNQQELKYICDLLCDNIEEVLSALDLHDYRDNGKMITMACPIHGGDNDSALNLYYEGDSYRGNWKCRTHGCEKIFKSSILGFIRGVISAQKYGWEKEGDKMCSFTEAMEFAKNFVSKDTDAMVFNSIRQNKNNFSRIVDKIIDKPYQESKITRETAIQNLNIPAKYYIDRGFSETTLNKYDVGLCQNPKKPMYNRVVVPVYDNSGKYLVGCTGRSIYKQCDKCKSYHKNTQPCPENNKTWVYSKWKHSQGFKSQNHLYNFWNAKEYIQKNNYAIIVESPGNVWKLEENGIYNSVAVFGCNLSDRQKLILDSSGAMTLIVIMDNDEAGHKATEEIKQKCENTYKLLFPKIDAADIADLNIEQIKELKTFIEVNI